MLKKTFPVIVVLIALSVLGVIVLQVSWIKNMILLQQERYVENAGNAGYDVKEEIIRQIGAPVRRMPGIGHLFAPGIGSLVISRPTVSSHFTSAEVSSIIRRALDAKRMKDVSFEFGITRVDPLDGVGIELQSKNFIAAYLDTVNNRNVSIPIIAETQPDLTVINSDETLVITITNIYSTVVHSLIWMLLAAVAFTLILISAFVLTLKTIINQRNLSKIKNDFVNNMTHELKTPLATISLAVDALQNSKVVGNAEKSFYFSDIIRQENKRMNKHVETILQAALMDKQEMKLNFVPLHAHEIIRKVVNTFTLQLNQKGGTAELLLNAKSDLVRADETHFTNLINNLIDNAVKYSKEDLHITVSTHCTSKYLVIQVQDNGIGMSKETVKRIFEKFYRAHTGNVHDVKGFGLGMSYVKSVVDAHQGKIKVDSVQGKGSTFITEIPIYKAEK